MLAAGNLSFDAGKTAALRNVASRGSLTPAGQVHLVNTALTRLSFDAGKVDVLTTLIRNPAFPPAAKEAVFRQIERLQFDASRVRVMSAIQELSQGK